MGSRRFFRTEAGDQSRKLGTRIAELEFTDDDGVTIIASLNVDR